TIVLAVLAAVAVWWLATAVAMYRLRQSPETFPATFAASTLVAIVSVWLIVGSADNATVIGAVAAFIGAVGVWSWHEIAYLIGYVSGPEPAACPPGASDGERFRRGVNACLYHEIAIVVTAAMLVVMLVGAANPVAAWTFSALWLMRWSTKLNIFLGVRNLHTEFWPHHLKYLETYTRQRRMNALFPLSLIAAAAAIWWVVDVWSGRGPGSYASVGGTLVTTLLVLAVIEHLFLMMKVPDDWLWRPVLRLPTD
ncbi:MAG: putative photosynthetic complex assembly protein PuhE, partial [Pseudomonadota bacterium]